MKLFTTIFCFEWLQLRRQRTQLLALIVFLLVGLYAVYSGNAVTTRQHTVIDSLGKQYQRDYELALKKFGDTLTPEAKVQAAFAGLPQMINFRIPPLAIDTPSGLAVLSIGQRDINPYYQKVKSNVSFLDNQNVEISNPSTLFAGNFDLSFVFIYLLPLLVITMCYGSYAEERELGTYSLLSIQAVSIEKVMVFKLLFRGIVVLGCALLLCAAGFVVANLTNGPNVIELMQWTYLTIIYLVFWFAVCYFFIQCKGSSIVTALQLVGTWLFFLILLPSLSNAYLSLGNPIPLRADLASYTRHTSEEVWKLEPRALAASFNRHNPRYNASINPAKDSTRSGPRFIVGYYDLLERKVGSYAKTLQRNIDKRSEAARNLAALNPSIMLQYLYNATARTGREDYRNFEKQIAVFQKKWKHHLYVKQLPELNFTKEELRELPEFKMVRQSDSAGVFSGSFTIWAGIFLFLILGWSQGKRDRTKLTETLNPRN